MNQLLMGISVPFVFFALAYLIGGRRASVRVLIAVPAFMAAGALWAVAPDLPRLFGCMDLYMRLATDPRTDICLWHYTIDQLETDSPWFAVGFVVILAAMLFAAWRELRLAEAGSGSAEESGKTGHG